MSPISSQAYLKRATEGLLSNAIDYETIITKLDDGSSFVLNRLGTLIWNLMDGQRTIAEIALAVCEKYDVTPETALSDTIELAEGLLARQLVAIGAVPFAENENGNDRRVERF